LIQFFTLPEEEGSRELVETETEQDPDAAIDQDVVGYFSSQRGGKATAHETKFLNINLPKIYMFREVVLHKLDTFDFGHHNHTSFAGLENTEPDRYINAWIHTLYFMDPLRLLVMSHVCADSACLACELGFLFRILEFISFFLIINMYILSWNGQKRNIVKFV
jgi:hypothetical protein